MALCISGKLSHSVDTLMLFFSYLEGTIVHPSPRLQTAPIVEAVVSENNRDVHSSPPVVSCERNRIVCGQIAIHGAFWSLGVVVISTL